MQYRYVEAAICRPTERGRMQKAILQGACSPRAPLVGHRVVGGGIRRDGDGVEVPGRAARTGRETLRAPAKAEGRWCHETAVTSSPAAAPNWSPLAPPRVG